MQTPYRNLTIRPWCPADRQAAMTVIASVLQEYGLPWQPGSADQDVVNVENHYLQQGGEFWVVESPNAVTQSPDIVGTAAYYPIEREPQAVEIRKMYLLPTVRGLGLGAFLLTQLETAIATAGYRVIWIETASCLKEAVGLYESRGYEPATGIETARCDRVYRKALSPGTLKI